MFTDNPSRSDISFESSSSRCLSFNTFPNLANSCVNEQRMVKMDERIPRGLYDSGMCENSVCESVTSEFTGSCLTPSGPQIATCHANCGRPTTTTNNSQMNAFDRVVLQQTYPKQLAGICGDGSQADVDNSLASDRQKRSSDSTVVDSNSSNNKKFIPNPKLQDDLSIGLLVPFESPQQTGENNWDRLELCENSNAYKYTLSTAGSVMDSYVVESYPRHFGASDSAIPSTGHQSTKTIHSHDTFPATSLMDISYNHAESEVDYFGSTCIKQSSTSNPVQEVTLTAQLTDNRYQLPSNTSHVAEHYTINELHETSAFDDTTASMKQPSSFGKQLFSHSCESDYLRLPDVQHVSSSNISNNKLKTVNSQHQIDEWYKHTPPVPKSLKVREERLNSLDYATKVGYPESCILKSDKQYVKNPKMAAFQSKEKEGLHITNADANVQIKNCVRENISDSNRSSSFGTLNAKAYNTFQRIEQHMVTTFNIHTKNESVESLQQQLDLLSEVTKTDHVSFQLFENPYPIEKQFKGAIDCGSNKASLLDVDEMIGSGVTVAGFKPRSVIRKKRKTTTPNDSKNSDYWHKRRKNNDSARRSREGKKEKEKRFYKRALELEYQNIYLRECISFAMTELAALGRNFVPPLPGTHQISRSQNNVT